MRKFKYSTLISDKNNLNPNWITGFTDAEGCFTIIISKRNKTKWRISISFEINLHKKDKEILLNIQKFFQTGHVIDRKEKNISVYRITKIKEIIENIIPHFENYPLITQKYSDYKLWKDVVFMIDNKDHLNENGFKKILNYYNSINRKASLRIINQFPDISIIQKNQPNLPTFLNPYWVSGFTAGDGGFNIGIRPKTKQIYFRFAITQHSKDLELMKLFINFFKCGKINIRKKNFRCDYYIQDSKKINNHIISHFDKYPLQNKKTKDFLYFKKALTYFFTNKEKYFSKIENIKNKLNS